MKVTLLIPTAAFAEKATTAALARYEVYQEATDNQTPMEIAQKFGYDVDDLIAANSKDGGAFDSRTKANSRLRKGTQVLLPGAPTVEPSMALNQAEGGADGGGEGATGTDEGGRAKRRRVTPSRFSEIRFLGSSDRVTAQVASAPPAQPVSPALLPAAAILPAADLELIGKVVRLRVLGHGEHDGRITGLGPSTPAGEHRFAVLFKDKDVRWYTAAQLRKALK